jgi:hypothetical protein
MFRREYLSCPAVFVVCDRLGESNSWINGQVDGERIDRCINRNKSIEINDKKLMDELMDKLTVCPTG